MYLEQLSYKEAGDYFARRDIAVIPVGSIENHGPHLCLGTDIIIPRHIAKTLSRELGVLILPELSYGVADHHAGFAGTVTIGYDGLKMLASLITEQLYGYGIRRFIFLNGHGGNDQALIDVGLILERRGAVTAIANWWQLAGQINPAWAGGHGGGEETAAILAIDPALVTMENHLPLSPVPVSQELPVTGVRTVGFGGADFLVARRFKSVTPAGWYGPDNPQDATAEWGHEMLSAVTELIKDFVSAIERAPLPEPLI